MGKLSSADYLHLHVHTQYSLLDGLTKLPALIDRVSELGMSSIAMTDHGTLSGAIDFYKAAKQKNIKPIIGIETYIASRSLHNKEASYDKNNYHLILLAMNETGYKNLMRLSTIANLEGYYYKPRMDHDVLEKYNEGIIVLSGCIGGEVGDALRQGQYEKAKKIASWYKSVFKDRYYFEIQDHGHKDHPNSWDEQIAVTEKTFELAKDLDIPCVLTCDSHYLVPDDQEAHEILLCVQTGSFLDDEKRMSLKDFDLYVSDPKDIINRWGKDHPEIISNTAEIADRCDINIELGNILIPKFPLPKGESEKHYLELLVYRGLAWRYGGVSHSKISDMSITEAKKHMSKAILDRAQYELGVINSMGFNGYFLIISDFINWGKEKGIVFGPGRGSAAGSIISYALRITELDPIKYDLLFERFLNPDRISMPDIDIDIQDTRRDEVIQYCVEKYGEDRVANIVTFGRMAARNAVRDVARVLQVPYAEADRLAKMIPPPVQGRHIPLSQSLKDNEDLKKEYQASETSKRVFDLAVQLEGTIRSHGVHAAGVVIAPGDIVNYAPLEKAQKGAITTQYSMGPIEELGLLKMDFLGLSNLTIIKNALRIIKKVHNKSIDIAEINLNDKKTFELFQRGDTTGVFQLESAGMKRYLKELKPTVFDDIIAMVALYRPGPMQWIDDFIARKHGHKQIEYVHPAMEPALRNTYGVVVYQEQVMQISKEIAGFTGGQADTLRKGIGKKIPEVLKKLKDEFINGAVETVQANRKDMEAFWKSLEDFAAYCFNKSHAACYAMIAYQTAYLKAHYPGAFMAALMTSNFDDNDKLSIEIKECQNMGISVLPPDVNESFHEFALVPGTNHIRYGLGAVKNVGASAVEEILRARDESGGSFENLESFIKSVNTRVVNRKSIESLIKCGALDRFDSRSTLIANLDIIMAFAGKSTKENQSGQTDLFGNKQSATTQSILQLEKPINPAPLSEQLLWERELLGLYLSQHPLEAFETFLIEQTVPIKDIEVEHHNKKITIGGYITNFREITTKNGKKMAFATVADKDNEVEIVLFPNVYQQTIGVWAKDKVVIVKGKIATKNEQGDVSGEIKILVEDGREVTHEQAINYEPTGKQIKKPKKKVPIKEKAKGSANLDSTNIKIYVRITDSTDQKKLLRLKDVIDNSPGMHPVILVLGPNDNKQAIKLPNKFDHTKLAILEETIGKENVIAK